MSDRKNLIRQYRDSRKGQEDYRLTNTISLAAEIILNLEAEHSEPEQAASAWEIVEALIRQYARGREDA